MTARDEQPKGPNKQDHAERAATALRENLRKRKAQQRERAERAEPAPGDAVDQGKR